MNEQMAALSAARDWAARALAFARAAEPRTAPSRRSIEVDIALAATAAVASLITLLAIYTARGAVSMWLSPSGLVIASRPVAWHMTAGAVASVAVTTAPLALRRVCPLTAFWVLFLGTVLTSGYINTVTIIAVLLAAYSAVVHSQFRGAALISVLLAGLLATAMFANTTPPLPGRFTALFMLVPTALVGNAVQMWRRQARDSQARLRDAQADHEAATVRALVAERARIASELHDVVTHNVSVMVVQTGAARQVLAISPDQATAALLAAEACGRTAMTELQHLLGLLSPVEGVQPHDAELLEPQPGLDQLRRLIERVAAAGLLAELKVTGQPRTPPPGVDLTAYRVIQESLTNVMKHTARAKTAVRLEYRPDELVIDVSDDGHRDTITTAGGSRPEHAGGPGGRSTVRPLIPGRLAGSGRGLLGLRERVSLYGGEFDAGPRPAGGWRVRARLPLNPAAGNGAGDNPGRQGQLSSVPAPL